MDYGTGSHIDHLKSYISKISGYDKKYANDKIRRK